jgi:signal transduction histidine kinase/CheY-like chemotaxis protein
MPSDVDISIVVSIAALLVLFSLILCAIAMRRNSDAESRRGMAWLFAANTAFLISTAALLLRDMLPFWFGASLVIAGAHLGIVFGYFALCRSLGRVPHLARFAAVAAVSVGGQAAVALVFADVAVLILTSSAINGALGLVIARLLWPMASPLGREYAMLAALPFGAIAVSYLARLAFLLLGLPEQALLIATLMITFLLAFSALQWCFALISYRAVRINMRLETERIKAQEASRLKSQFLANMSHEIRTPLNGVLGMAQMLRDQIAAPDQRQMIETIQDSGESLLSILNDILDISKIEAGRMELETAPFVPAEVIARLERLYTLHAREKGLALSVDCAADLTRPRIGDAHRIAQILNNLLSNAIKFTDTGSVSLCGRTTPDGALRIIIQDSGIGMTEDQMTRVFDEFVQADASITRRFGGTGLGMPIVQRLVAMMGGTLDVDTVPGRGTRIALTLPLPEAPAAAAAPAGPVRESGDLSGLRILMAEDNLTNQLVVKAMLKGSDADLTIVGNGRLAVEAAAEADFDLLLFDISMPEMDGPTALRQIVRDRIAAGRPRPPAIALTANVMASQIVEYHAAGFHDHLAKPVRRADLLARIADATGRAPRAVPQAAAG